MGERLRHVQLTLSFEREGNKWVGTCVEMSTSTYARTLKDCESALRELVLEHLNLLEQAGERRAFFERWGIELSPAKPKSIVLHPHGSNWKQVLKSTSNGPFYQPGVFPVGGLTRGEKTGVSV